ncbi:hypothetical protein J6590_066255 [Homalodisca vitripennis]|nr:hypothetical protein J6590_066255 [Homalodisca vitripennis]
MTGDVSGLGARPEPGGSTLSRRLTGVRRPSVAVVMAIIAEPLSGTFGHEVSLVSPGYPGYQVASRLIVNIVYQDPQKVADVEKYLVSLGSRDPKTGSSLQFVKGSRANIALRNSTPSSPPWNAPNANCPNRNAWTLFRALLFFIPL